MFSLKKSSSIELLDKKIIFKYWSRYYRLLFIFLFILTACAGAYVWYRTIQRFDWTNNPNSDAYIIKNQEIVFKEKEFKKAIDDMKKRKELFESDAQTIKNVFSK